MATFTINFQANTTGIHHVGYRTYNDTPNTYTVVDVNVVTPGVQAVTIDVPGNLYCAYDGILYSGYIIAACQSQVDANLDGVPDLAINWTVLLAQQTDPCVETAIVCEAAPIDDVTILINGTGNCTPAGNYTLTVTEATPGDEVEPATVTAVVAGGVVTSVAVVAPGKYKDTPVLSLSIAGTCDVAPTFQVTLGNCPSLLLEDYVCGSVSNLSETSDFILALDEGVVICADVATLVGLPNNFSGTPGDNCHCKECKNVTIAATGATTGVGKVSYQTCWDDSNNLGTITIVSRIVNYNDIINLGCILPNTLVFEQGTLDAPIVVTANVACV